MRQPAGPRAAIRAPGHKREGYRESQPELPAILLQPVGLYPYLLLGIERDSP